MAAAHPRKLQTLWHFSAIFALPLLVWLAFGGGLNNGFVWDDHELVVRNADVQTGTLGKFLTSGAWAFQQNSNNNNYYRPLQILTYRLVDAVAGLSPQAFHLASLLLHIGATLACYAVLYKLLQMGPAALAGAAIFALHPMHSEAIDWIACSTELGCGLFLLISFYCYLCKGRIWSLLAFLAALLWKEMAVTLPLLIACHLLLVERAGFRRIAVLTAPYFGVLALYLGLRHNALGVFYASQAGWTLTPPAFVATVLQLTATYCWKLFLPINLNAYYVFEEPRWWIGLVFLAVSAGVIAYLYRRNSLAAFACAWTLLSLLPVLNVYHLGANIFGERYLYIPSVGFALLAALAYTINRYAAGAALAALLVWYSVVDIERTKIWADDFSLFSRTVTDSPRSAMVNRMMGDLLRTEKNDLAGAEESYQKAIDLARGSTPPQMSQMSLAYVGLAQIYDDTHQTAKALKSLDEARRINPANPAEQLARAVLLAENEDWPNAKTLLQKLLAADARNAAAWNTMGLVTWQGEHNNQLAIQYFERALSLGSTGVTAASIQNNLGAMAGEERKYDQAITHFAAAAELDPQNPQYVTNVGNVYGMMGHANDALASFKRALEIRPGYPPALSGLAQLQANQTH